MTMKINRLKYAFLLLFSLAIPSILHAEELEMINRPVNVSGMTGLLITTAPFTLPPGTVEIGMSTQSENSLVPKYTSTVLPLTVSMGLTANKEVAVVVPYRYLNEFDAGKTRGMGDMELSFKWNIRPQPENSFRPGIALFGTGVIPTGDRDIGMNSVSHWGLRLGMSVGSEIAWEDRIIGIYADGLGAVQDLSDKAVRDSYTVVNAGILFPISKYRNLQMLVELSRRSGKDVETVDGPDHISVTYGLRLVGENFNLTFGTQFINRDVQGFDNSNKMIGMMSVKL